MQWLGDIQLFKQSLRVWARLQSTPRYDNLAVNRNASKDPPILLETEIQTSGALGVEDPRPLGSLTPAAAAVAPPAAAPPSACAGGHRAGCLPGSPDEARLPALRHTAAPWTVCIAAAAAQGQAGSGATRLEPLMMMPEPPRRSPAQRVGSSRVRWQPACPVHHPPSAHPAHKPPTKMASHSSSWRSHSVLRIGCVRAPP